MRRLTMATLLAIALFLAGCGASSDAAKPATTDATTTTGLDRDGAIEALSVLVYGPGFQPDEAGQVESFINRTLARCEDLDGPEAVADLVAGSAEAIESGASPELYQEVVEQLDIAFDAPVKNCFDIAVAVTANMKAGG